MTKIYARIAWIPEADGGRKRPPSVPKYRAPVVFPEQPFEHGVGWDLVVEKVEEEGEIWLARVAFGVDAAPSHLLSVGANFVLYEGGRRVATGVIVQALSEK